MPVLDIIGMSQVSTQQLTLNANQFNQKLEGCDLVSTTSFTYAYYYLREGDWLKLLTYGGASGNYTKRLGVGHRVGVFGIDQSKKYYGGFRYKKVSGIDSRFSAVLGIYDSGLGTTATLLVLLADNEIAGYVAGAEYYVEYALDYVNAIITIWVDGVKIKDVAFPTWITDILASDVTRLAVSYGSPTSVSVGYSIMGTMYIKDIYFKRADSVDEEFRLGPQSIVSLNLATVDAPNWVSSDESLTALQVLGTPITDVNSTLAPTTTSPTTKTPLQAGFTVPEGKGTINAISMAIAASRLSGTSAGLSTTLVEDGSQSNPKTTVLGSAISTGISAGTFAKTPKNNPLTPESVAELRLKVTPINA